jgi:hypothetical protein
MTDRGKAIRSIDFSLLDARNSFQGKERSKQRDRGAEKREKGPRITRIDTNEEKGKREKGERWNGERRKEKIKPRAKREREDESVEVGAGIYAIDIDPCRNLYTWRSVPVPGWHLYPL